MIWPVGGTFTSPFGMRWGRLHAGVDLAAPEGTPIRAAEAGNVVLAGWTGGYGNYTCIAHGGGLSTCYAHQSRYGTSVGAKVTQGQVIGYVGNTGHSFGAHLHFETRINGIARRSDGVPVARAAAAGQAPWGLAPGYLDKLDRFNVVCRSARQARGQLEGERAL